MRYRCSRKIVCIEVWFKFFSIVGIKSLVSCFTVEELCRELIPQDYEIYKAPGNNGKPLNVFIGFQVLDIGEINEERMDYHFHLFIMYAWNDTRLKLEKYTSLGRTAILYSECKNYMWTPDVFFEAAKEIETFQKTSPTTILNVFQDGSIVMSVRYTFKSDCPMEFADYPFDTQRCQFLVAMLYSHDGIAKLKWIDDPSSPINDSPIQMMRPIDLLQYYLLDATWTNHIKVRKSANYTTLVAEFPILRRLTGCVLSTYAPSLLIVIMSWVTFWLRLDSIPARVALSITSLLTLCTQAQQSKSSLPAVNYMTALDIWLFMCIITVFSTLIITALSYNVSSKKCKACSTFEKIDTAISKRSTGSSNYSKSSPWVLNNKKIAFIDDSSARTSKSYLKKVRCLSCLSNQKMGHRIDEISKIAFPASFILASIFYCSYYLNVYYEYN